MEMQSASELGQQNTSRRDGSRGGGGERHGALPAPNRAHATCAWCRTDFCTIGELIDHVDNAHVCLPARAA